MTSHFFESDDTSPEYQHHRFLALVIAAVPVLIMASVVSSLLGMG